MGRLSIETGPVRGVRDPSGRRAAVPPGPSDRHGYDLLAFRRWLVVEDQPLPEVTTEVLLRLLRACREAKIPGRPGPNVVTMSGRRMDQYAATTINRRLAAISGLFAFAAMRDPDVKNPVPKAREARWRTTGGRSGMLAHTVRRRKNRSSLRLRSCPPAVPGRDARPARTRRQHRRAGPRLSPLSASGMSPVPRRSPP
nr:site-specific integrase [Gandjariella thermophila]